MLKNRFRHFEEKNIYYFSSFEAENYVKTSATNEETAALQCLLIYKVSGQCL